MVQMQRTIPSWEQSARVKVKRSNGDLEDGWRVKALEGEGTVTVRVRGPDGATKEYPIEALLKLNA